MKQLVNFSVYDMDLERFGHDWLALQRYVRWRRLDGLELLIGFDPPPVVPAGLVQAVHLPFWVTWLDVWRDRPEALERYYGGLEPEWLKFYCGGHNSGEIIAVLRQLWLYAARLKPAYAVFHVSHVEVAHAFTRRYPYSDLEVIEAAADMLNAAAAMFDDGEPPVRLFLENLWWPGLTFTDNQVAEHLAGQLTFDNWAFVLDTGHLMNTNLQLDEEEAAIDYVLATVEKLSAGVRQRIEGLHFNLSLSGAYQRERVPLGLPAGFEQLPLLERLELGRCNAVAIDQHRPFTSPRCREIIAAVQPNFVTHEFLSASRAEFEWKLTTQQKALESKSDHETSSVETSGEIIT